MPKCHSTDIIRIPGESGGLGIENNLRTGAFGQVLVSRYFCCNCGFVEDFVDTQKEREKINKYYLKKQNRQ